ncbi:MAG TPA: hypothetical protein VE398_20660 [Acidobacteriota bacterium]|nr:hypothetical protein [Acidobacteriota bacterium]
MTQDLVTIKGYTDSQHIQRETDWLDADDMPGAAPLGCSSAGNQLGHLENELHGFTQADREPSGKIDAASREVQRHDILLMHRELQSPEAHADGETVAAGQATICYEYVH